MALNRRFVLLNEMSEIQSSDRPPVGKALTGRNLRWVREVVAERMSDCAKMMDVHLCTWSLWEKGHRWPDPEVMVRFCQITGVTMDFIYRSNLRGVAEDVAFHLLAEHRELELPAQVGAVRARTMETLQKRAHLEAV